MVNKYQSDLNNIKSMYDKYDKTRPEIKKSIIDNAPIRFEYRHPLILEDGSLIADSDYSPLFKIDICSFASSAASVYSSPYASNRLDISDCNAFLS